MKVGEPLAAGEAVGGGEVLHAVAGDARTVSGGVDKDQGHTQDREKYEVCMNSLVALEVGITG